MTDETDDRLTHSRFQTHLVTFPSVFHQTHTEPPALEARRRPRPSWRLAEADQHRRSEICTRMGYSLPSTFRNFQHSFSSTGQSTVNIGSQDNIERYVLSSLPIDNYYTQYLTCLC